ncbi:uncharacterized protein MONBRDRAFT_32001 [Monosiga brevicollis MX1]|uniref:Signal peptidase complex subunit 2 n=1 Tax=Monosiga brevicollis TaxID=81824 RepID=A9UWS4_MONBE|nr:uncharacterized protein MONBRDRAFT_32001 [Monosiga brevicollis MX1]EDQ90092.1 predicted protein [Monosiga brevicollis MX1]|eukprot:XP_001744859.1 hypothetical protein [Monosiga brevicollis MX1]
MGSKRTSRKAAPVPAKGGEPAQADEADAAPEVEAESPIIISKWDGQTVRNSLEEAFCKATGDAVPEEFEQATAEEDFKLIMAAIGCAFAGYACIYGLFVPHPASSQVVGICAAAYFVFMTILNVHAMFFDQHAAVLMRSQKTGQRLSTFVHMNKYSPELTVEMILASSAGTSSSQTFDGHVGQFFYEDGEMCREAVVQVTEDLLSQLLALKNE